MFGQTIAAEEETSAKGGGGETMSYVSLISRKKRKNEKCKSRGVTMSKIDQNYEMQ